MKKFFSFGWLSGLFAGANKVASRVQEVMNFAMPIVEQIAALTPTRMDDEIIALFEKYGVRNLNAYLALPVSDRGPALLVAATKAVQDEWPGVPVSQIQAGVQLAVLALKNKA